MGCGTSFVKYVIFFFNLLVALLGLAILGIGIAFLLNFSFIKDEVKNHLTVGPWIFIIVGAIMFIIAFFGCCGAIRESHCMVVTYAIFLLVIIIIQVALAVLLFVYGDNIKQSIVSGINGLYEKRTRADVDKSFITLIENIEIQFQCCGGKGPSDYGFTLPDSCCSRDPSLIGIAFGNKCTSDNANDGCSKVIGDKYEKWNKPIAGIAIGVACVEVVGALFALCLANSIRNMDRRYV
ncbi:hypothetical protein K1T71_003713 [Dendrolimus kikuchii]|uniref:Uncharacterized protein n=1 Tax=Dendrolimus kikuchii TaxID=765133 RepID=A0ACC1D969_9NEOP|nr:hypothetical protein K1T71_003713 [Dendrolimus kikuchii]